MKTQSAENKKIPRHSCECGNPVDHRHIVLKQRFESLRDIVLLDTHFRGYDVLTFVGQ